MSGNPGHWTEKSKRALAVLGVLAFSAWPGAALANCPTADDLTGGIRFAMPDGAYWDLSGHGSDRVAYFQWSPDFEVQRMELAEGIFIASLVADSMEEPWRSEFEPRPSAFPEPAANTAWETRMTSRGLGINRVDDMTYTFGAAQQMTFGDCAFTYLPMTLRSEPVSQEGEGVSSEYLYFPELGGIVIQDDGYGNTWPITGISVR